MEGPTDQVVTVPTGESLRVRRAPSPGVALIIESLETHEGFSSTSWEPAGHRPSGYPEHLPFLPGTHTMVLARPGSTTLTWGKAASGHDTVLVGELVADGWVETVLLHPTMPGVTIRPFRREDRQRILIRGGEFLSLLDTRAE